MKAALELAISTELHKDDLVKRQADEVQGLGDGRRTPVLYFGHLGRLADENARGTNETPATEKRTLRREFREVRKRADVSTVEAGRRAKLSASRFERRQDQQHQNRKPSTKPSPSTPEHPDRRSRRIDAGHRAEA